MVLERQNNSTNREMEVLSLKNIYLSFTGVQAVIDLSLKLFQNEILAIIGPNGAGKTCTLNCISGFYSPSKGEIHFMDRRIDGLPSHMRAKLGIARVFQNIALYTGMTALDNIMVARQMFMKRGIVAGALYYGWALREESEHRFAVEEIIDFLDLQPIRKKEVGNLPYGVRKRVDLGRALAMEPKVLLLDEPMAGMNVEEKEDMARFIIDICEEKKIPIIIVEHDMGLVMDICNRVVVMDFGRKISEGSPKEVANDPKVISAYLGHEALEFSYSKAP